MDSIVTVGRGSRSEHEVAVAKACVTRWSVVVEGGYDVNFEVYFYPTSGGEGHVAKPPTPRVKTDVGAFAANQPGRLVFRFDNRYSVLRSKGVSISVLHTDQAPFSDAEIEDSLLMNERFMVGIEMFFTNRFADAEQFFAMEKDRVRRRSRHIALSFPGGQRTFSP